MEQDRKHQIQRKVLLLAMLMVSCLGTSGFAVSLGISTYQRNKQLVQVDAKEKSDRLTDLFSKTAVALSKDSDSTVHSGAFEAFTPNNTSDTVTTGNIVHSGADESFIEMVRYRIGTAFVMRGIFKLKSHATTTQNLNRELMMIGVASAATLVLLLLMLRSIQQFKAITFSDHLICYFSEEIVSELVALRDRLTKEKKSTWLIRFILFYQILTLGWGIYIQIDIDNRTLPSRDRKIDK
jgi:hypothetical protein